MSGENSPPREPSKRGCFTVVIPVWNGKGTIERAIESALAQSQAPAEIIVIDDGSTDETGPLVMDRYPSVRVVRQGNAGAGPARRRGIVAAQSDWIAFLDADDMWAPWHLEELDELRTRFPEARLIATRHVEVPIGQDPVEPPMPRRVRRESIDYFTRAAHDISIIFTSSAAAERAALISADCFVEEGLGEDLAAWARLALQHPVAISSLTTAYYLRRIDSLMAMSSKQDWPASFSATASMGVVLRAMEGGEHAVPVDSLLTYLDGRILSGWKRLLILGDRRAARDRIAHLSMPWAPKTLGLRLAAAAPVRFGPILYKMVSTIRRIRVFRSRRQ